MFGCERCGARYNSARAAAIRDCPRCLLRDDVASPMSWIPDRPRPVVASENPKRYGKRTTGERNAGHSVPP
jgi:predicted  nucleic acid-binding Zn-ribbon protein